MKIYHELLPSSREIPNADLLKRITTVKTFWLIGPVAMTALLFLEHDKIAAIAFFSVEIIFGHNGKNYEKPQTTKILFT